MGGPRVEVLSRRAVHTGNRARHVLSPRILATDSAVRLWPIRSAGAACSWKHTRVHVDSVVAEGVLVGGGGAGSFGVFFVFLVASDVGVMDVTHVGACVLVCICSSRGC